MPVFPVFKRQRRKNQHEFEFEDSMGYIVIPLSQRKRGKGEGSTLRQRIESVGTVQSWCLLSHHFLGQQAGLSKCS